MTTKLTISRFRTRKPDPVAATAYPVQGNAAVAASAVQAVDNPFAPEPGDDGFASESFLPPQPAAPQAALSSDASPPEEIDAIRKEGLTGRQLRVARRMAQKHDLPATSDFDAVRLLRKAGIDPFGRSAVLELVQGNGTYGAGLPQISDGSSHALALTADNLPQTVKPAPLPSTEVRLEQSHIAEVRRIQSDIVARRRRAALLMWAKLAVFVLLPTFMGGWYYFMVATPMYSVTSKFVIQQATAASQISSLFSGTSFATGPDSVAVQGYLQSPVAMERLDADKGFRAHFSAPDIDPIQRLPEKASKTQTYSLYQRYVKVSYDPTEGLINLEVSAADPNVAVDFSKALIGYAEGQVDNMSKRQRGDQEANAKANFEDAQAKLLAAQTKLVGLQEKYKTLSTEVEAAQINAQITQLNAQLMTEKLSLAQLQANAEPNKARMDPVITRINTLNDQIAQLKQGLTEGDGNGPSVASVQSQMVMATAEVTTRQMMLAQATSAMETSRIEANRQTRYLELAVEPTAPDTPSYPRAFENTLVVMLIFGGIYLMISMTIAILREQVSG